MRLCNRNLSLLLIPLLLMGCSKRPLTISEFASAVQQDQDFVRQYKDETFYSTCAYYPSEMMALLELRGDLAKSGPAGSEQFEKAKSAFSSAHYFTVTLGLNDSSDVMRYGIADRQYYAVRVQDLTFRAASQFYILTERQDTIKPLIADLQRNYGLSPQATFMVAFPKEQLVAAKQFHVVYHDAHFGIGQPIRFDYATQSLRKELPAISF